MKIYLLRHAERGHGKEQDELTSRGANQSEEIIPFLKEINPDYIICAETNRAKKTIEPFLKKYNLNAEYTPLVNEQEMGELLGKSGSEYRKKLEESGLNKQEFRPKGGENYFDLLKRARIFLDKIKKEKYKNILISTHAGFIRSVIKLILDIPSDELVFDPASISVVELDKDFNIIRYELNKKIFVG